MAHNTMENVSQQHQYGGTFWVSSGHATQHITGSTIDPSGLGRWVTCTLASRTGKQIHLISGYHPCQHLFSQLCSVYAQHLCHFASSHCTECPCNSFFTDLSQIIQELKQLGDKVLLLADFN